MTWSAPSELLPAEPHALQVRIAELDNGYLLLTYLLEEETGNNFYAQLIRYTADVIERVGEPVSIHPMATTTVCGVNATIMVEMTSEIVLWGVLCWEVTDGPYPWYTYYKPRVTFKQLDYTSSSLVAKEVTSTGFADTTPSLYTKGGFTLLGPKLIVANILCGTNFYSAGDAYFVTCSFDEKTLSIQREFWLDIPYGANAGRAPILARTGINIGYYAYSPQDMYSTSPAAYANAYAVSMDFSTPAGVPPGSTIPTLGEATWLDGVGTYGYLWDVEPVYDNNSWVPAVKLLTGERFWIVLQPNQLIEERPFTPTGFPTVYDPIGMREDDGHISMLYITENTVVFKEQQSYGLYGGYNRAELETIDPNVYPINPYETVEPDVDAVITGPFPLNQPDKDYSYISLPAVKGTERCEYWALTPPFDLPTDAVITNISFKIQYKPDSNYVCPGDFIGYVDLYPILQPAGWAMPWQSSIIGNSMGMFRSGGSDEDLDFYLTDTGSSDPDELEVDGWITTGWHDVYKSFDANPAMYRDGFAMKLLAYNPEEATAGTEIKFSLALVRVQYRTVSTIQTSDPAYELILVTDFNSATPQQVDMPLTDSRYSCLANATAADTYDTAISMRTKVGDYLTIVQSPSWQVADYRVNSDIQPGVTMEFTLSYPDFLDEDPNLTMRYVKPYSLTAPTGNYELDRALGGPNPYDEATAIECGWNHMRSFQPNIFQWWSPDLGPDYGDGPGVCWAEGMTYPKVIDLIEGSPYDPPYTYPVASKIQFWADPGSTYRETYWSGQLSALGLDITSFMFVRPVIPGANAWDVVWSNESNQFLDVKGRVVNLNTDVDHPETLSATPSDEIVEWYMIRMSTSSEADSDWACIYDFVINSTGWEMKWNLANPANINSTGSGRLIGSLSNSSTATDWVSLDIGWFVSNIVDWWVANGGRDVTSGDFRAFLPMLGVPRRWREGTQPTVTTPTNTDRQSWLNKSSVELKFLIQTPSYYVTNTVSGELTCWDQNSVMGFVLSSNAAVPTYSSELRLAQIPLTRPTQIPAG